MGMILCLRCGKPNSPKENYCLHCGATLPKLAYAIDMVPVEKVDDRYHQFAEAARRVQSGEISLDEFMEFMETTYNKLTKIEDEIREVNISEDIMDAFEEELDVGFQGVELFNEGMETMMAYADDEDPAHLANGLRLIEQGNNLIHRARIINRERDSKLGADADMFRQSESMEL